MQNLPRGDSLNHLIAGTDLVGRPSGMGLMLNIDLYASRQP